MYLQKKNLPSSIKKKHVQENIHIRIRTFLTPRVNTIRTIPSVFTDRANYISETSLTSSEATKKPPASWIDSFAREERLLVYTRNDR